MDKKIETGRHKDKIKNRRHQEPHLYVSRRPQRHFYDFMNPRSVAAGITLTRVTSSLQHVELTFFSRQQENPKPLLRLHFMPNLCRTVILPTCHREAHQAQDYPARFHGWEWRQFMMKGLCCAERRETGQGADIRKDSLGVRKSVWIRETHGEKCVSVV